MIARRGFIVGSLALGAAGAQGVSGAIRTAPDGDLPGNAVVGDEIARKKIVALEKGQARLGVCLLDTATGEMIGNRMHEHFAMCSSFKLALAACCLREAEAGRVDLDQELAFSQADLVSYSPVLERNLDQGQMSVRELARVTTTTSDNAAANLLIRHLGGPDSVTALFRQMGDRETRLDRYEPMMNLVLSADLRDTTTPAAMAKLVGNLTTGSLLSAQHRQTLIQWMIDTRTGLKRIRAGLPQDWVAGDKTGTGLGPGTTNKYNDVALAYPPGRAPIIISAYFDSALQSDRIEPEQQSVLAEVGRIAVDWVKRS